MVIARADPILPGVEKDPGGQQFRGGAWRTESRAGVDTVWGMHISPPWRALLSVSLSIAGPSPSTVPGIQLPEAPGITEHRSVGVLPQLGGPA